MVTFIDLSIQGSPWTCKNLLSCLARDLGFISYCLLFDSLTSFCIPCCFDQIPRHSPSAFIVFFDQIPRQTPFAFIVFFTKYPATLHLHSLFSLTKCPATLYLHSLFSLNKYPTQPNLHSLFSLTKYSCHSIGVPCIL